MKIETIFAPNARDAARQVRELFGKDALILSSTTVNGGIKLIATGAADLDTLVQAADEVTGRDAWSATEPAQQSITPSQPGALLDPSEVMGELRRMHSEMTSQLAEIQVGTSHHRDPYRAKAMREMLAAGFGPLLSRYMSEKMPAPAQGGEDDAMQWINNALKLNLSCLDDDSDLIKNGGVIALIGPTGVGKTTTAAKLAARFVAAHGSGKVALITTDTFRIGAVEQLSIYGRILRTPVHAVNDEQELQAALRDLQSRHTVVIDTVGMSQRDENVAKQAALLANGGTEVKRILCLNAAATGDTLEEVVTKYAADGVDGCILTKIDEAATMGGVIDVLLRHRLKVFYVATGQQVPEDLGLTSGEGLVAQTFALAKNVRSAPIQDGEISLAVDDKALAGAALQEVAVG